MGPGKQEEGPCFALGGCEFLQSTQKQDKISEKQRRETHLFLLPLGQSHRFGFGSAKAWAWGRFESFITISRRGKEALMEGPLKQPPAICRLDYKCGGHSSWRALLLHSLPSPF